MLRTYFLRILVVALLCTQTFAITVHSGLSTSRPASLGAAVVPPFWFSPVVDLVKLAIGKLRDKKDTKDTVTKSLNDMQEQAQALEPLPKLLVESRQLRRKAIEMAQTARLGARDENAADIVWSSVKTLFADTNDSFKRVYEAAEFRKLLLPSPELQMIEDNAKNALVHIRDTLDSAKPQAKERRQALALIESDLNAVTTAGQYPEYWIAAQSQSVVDGYKKLAKESAPKNPKQADTSAQSLMSTRFVFAAFSESNEEPRQAPDSMQALPQESPEYLVALQKDIAKPVEPPPSAAEALRKSRQGGANYIPASGAFLGGLFAGVGGLKAVQSKLARTNGQK
jgi:hypothetical protein